MRELDPLVSRSPVARTGPSHIATVKTFEPPFDRARRAGGSQGRDGVGRTSSSRPRHGELDPPRPPHERRAPPLPRAGCEDAEDADVPARLRGRWRARAHRGREEEARRRLAVHARGAARTSSPTSAPTRSASGRSGSAEILRRERHQLHPLLRDQRAIAGIGRAHANEILWLAKLSPFKMSTDLSDEEVERLAEAIEGRPHTCARAARARERATLTSTGCTATSASRARSATTRCGASRSRSTRSPTAPRARRAAASSRIAACHGCCASGPSARSRSGRPSGVSRVAAARAVRAPGR